MSNLMKRFEEQFGLTLTEDGRIVTTSLKVKDIFGKEHKSVLEKIRDYIDLIPELGQQNFMPSSYINEQNKKQPMYIMDKKGFAMLVNKFTGDEATIFTYNYINAFEEMEKEIERLKSDVKAITEVAISDKDQKERISEMNKINFSQRKVQSSFAECVDYEQYKDMHDRFIEYIKPMDAEKRVLKMEYAVKGMKKLIQNLLIIDMANAGYSFNIYNNMMNMLMQIDKVNNKSLGGEKAAKTKTINKLTGNVDIIKSELEEAKNKVNDLEILLENSIIYPPIEDFITINKHGMSNNSMYDILPDKTKIKSDTYVKWINSFPKYKMPPKEYWNVDWNQPIEMFINYVALPAIDSINMDKASVDQIIGRCYQENDNIVHQLHSARIGTCEKYWEGSISFYIRNIIS